MTLKTRTCLGASRSSQMTSSFTLLLSPQAQVGVRPRSMSVGSQHRAEQNGGRGSGSSEGSLLSQAIHRARQLEDDERSEKMGKTLICDG